MASDIQGRPAVAPALISLMGVVPSVVSFLVAPAALSAWGRAVDSWLPGRMTALDTRLQILGTPFIEVEAAIFAAMMGLPVLFLLLLPAIYAWLARIQRSFRVLAGLFVSYGGIGVLQSAMILRADGQMSVASLLMFLGLVAVSLPITLGILAVAASELRANAGHGQRLAQT